MECAILQEFTFLYARMMALFINGIEPDTEKKIDGVIWTIVMLLLLF